MKNSFLSIAAFLGLLTVVLGAFGAHSLKDKLDVNSMQSFETGVRYMMYHVLAIMLIQNSSQLSQKSRNTISLLFLLGILFFSGSIFIISTGIVSASHIWFITPLGGLFFIVGWCISAISFLRSKKQVTNQFFMDYIIILTEVKNQFIETVNKLKNQQSLLAEYLINREKKVPRQFQVLYILPIFKRCFLV